MVGLPRRRLAARGAQAWARRFSLAEDLLAAEALDDKRSFATALESCVDNAALIALLKECSPPEALEYVQSKLS